MLNPNEAKVSDPRAQEVMDTLTSEKDVVKQEDMVFNALVKQLGGDEAPKE